MRTLRLKVNVRQLYCVQCWISRAPRPRAGPARLPLRRESMWYVRASRFSALGSRHRLQSLHPLRFRSVCVIDV
eukprot:2384614-Prymnesium_polylepis.1